MAAVIAATSNLAPRSFSRSAIKSRGEQGRLREPAFQLADDALRVAIDVGTDLHHRRAPIAAGQRRQVRTRHDSRDKDGRPCDVLQAEDDTYLFRERRLFEMMQDDRVRGRHTVSSGLKK